MSYHHPGSRCESCAANEVSQRQPASNIDAPAGPGMSRNHREDGIITSTVVKTELMVCPKDPTKASILQISPKYVHVRTSHV